MKYCWQSKYKKSSELTSNTQYLLHQPKQEV